MCVSVFAAVGGGLVQTKAQCERCYSRAGEGEKREGWIRRLEVRKNPC